jgi:hypothetical protein
MVAMDSHDSQRGRGILRTLALVLVTVFVIGALFRLATAGTLDPISAPADNSMPSLASISDALFGSAYDSSAVDVDADGSMLEVAKCIMARMTGGVCPATSITFSLVSGSTANLFPNGGASDCDGDGDLDDGCFTAFCGDFILVPPSGATNRAIGAYGGETRETPTCAFPVIATCDEIGTSMVNISFCNGGLCMTKQTDFTITDFLSACP